MEDIVDINNMYQPGNCELHVLMFKGSQLRAWWALYTSEITSSQRVCLNPLTCKNATNNIFGVSKNYWSGQENQFSSQRSCYILISKCVRRMR